MQIHISPTDGVPIYLQIVQQVRRLVAWGELKPGEELPSIRGLAEQLVVNPNTIARAYRELEVAGVVVKDRGMGTFVAQRDDQLSHDEKISLLAATVDALLVESRQMEIPLEQVIDVLRSRYSSLFDESNTEGSSGR